MLSLSHTVIRKFPSTPATLWRKLPSPLLISTKTNVGVGVEYMLDTPETKSLAYFSTLLPSYFPQSLYFLPCLHKHGSVGNDDTLVLANPKFPSLRAHPLYSIWHCYWFLLFWVSILLWLLWLCSFLAFLLLPGYTISLFFISFSSFAHPLDVRIGQGSSWGHLNTHTFT